ncbi:MAG: YdcF family protein [Flavobacteriales bacterium]|nr:YdcF family protein [Flavobacteriales bacterium]HQV53704.1 YdcF family protein [Flavobacteriales bacterium]HQX30867.1 YdcF family protein [Flavobacteriales bacterium]HQX39332.1 YdcF family protein [Flavobacteriales bacterium]
MPTNTSFISKSLGKLSNVGKQVLGFAKRSLIKTLPWVGGIAIVLVVGAFTSAPYHMHRWLGMAGGVTTGPVNSIIVLGGSGMPSGPELLRLHYAAEVAMDNPSARILLVHPLDTTVAELMAEELIIRGVAVSRISMALQGTNTREQALLLTENDPSMKLEQVALVTAPENMYRSLAVFRKLGYTNVSGVPAFDNPMFIDLSYRHKKIGGKAYVPDLGDNLALRYNFWNYLKLEVTCLRELVAYGYYKMNGWV